MLGEYIKESKAFSPLEDNPMIYTLIIAKLAKNEKDVVEKDETLFNLINKVEKVIRKCDCNELKRQYNPIGMFGIFDEKTTKSNLQDYVKQYFVDFESIVANSEKTLDSAYEIHKMFKELTNSEEFQAFLKSL